MQFKTRKIDNVTIADLSGRLTAGDGATVIYWQIKKLLDSGSRKILLNMEGLELMDSSGLGELEKAHKACIAAGASIKLLNVSTGMLRVFELTNLTRSYQFFSNETEALNSFN